VADRSKPKAAPWRPSSAGERRSSAAVEDARRAGLPSRTKQRRDEPANLKPEMAHFPRWAADDPPRVARVFDHGIDGLPAGSYWLL
jgi:hypothetical protein